MRHAARFIGTLLMLVVWITPSSLPVQSSVQAAYFDDSDPTTMRMGNGYYEIGFRKSNGSISYVLDKATNQRVSEGSRYECLWGAYRGSDYVGGCNYNAAWANHFGYAWSAASNVLTLTFTPDPSAPHRVTTQVTVTASDQPWFDLRLQITSRWGSLLDYVLFPSDLVFLEADLQEAVLPVLPGIALNSVFFAQHRSTISKYPGDWFADYVHIASQKGNISVYTLFDATTVHPAWLGFNHDDSYIPGPNITPRCSGAADMRLCPSPM